MPDDGAASSSEYVCKLGTGQPGEYVCTAGSDHKVLRTRLTYTDFARKADTASDGTVTAGGARKIVVTDLRSDSTTTLFADNHDCMYFTEDSRGLHGGDCSIGQNSFSMTRDDGSRLTVRFDAWDSGGDKAPLVGVDPSGTCISDSISAFETCSVPQSKDCCDNANKAIKECSGTTGQQFILASLATMVPDGCQLPDDGTGGPLM